MHRPTLGRIAVGDVISIAQLAMACALRSEDFDHWSEVIATGSGYTRISIPQKRRRPREVLRPSVGLDRLLKQLRIGLGSTVSYEVPDEVHGFVRGRGIGTNAAQHLNKDVVLRVDLSDFFGTISGDRIKSALLALGLDEHCAGAVAGVTTVDGSLAQGFSTSPFLSNLVFLETDKELAEFAYREGVQYTRYVDDLAFSGSRDAIHDHFLGAVSARLNDFGWEVSQHKTRFMRRGKPQFVTGLYVGDPDGPHVPRSMKRLLRREVYYAGKYGLDDARTNSPTPMREERLAGWVHYAAHMDPMTGVGLRSRWIALPAGAPSSNAHQDWDNLLNDIGFPEDW